ncbi:MAG TPA: hypothetical protein VF377_06780 [Acidimicrobiia bacterium]
MTPTPDHTPEVIVDAAGNIYTGRYEPDGRTVRPDVFAYGIGVGILVDADTQKVEAVDLRLNLLPFDCFANGGCDHVHILDELTVFLPVGAASILAENLQRVLSSDPRPEVT